MSCHFRYRKPCEGKSEVYWTNITDRDAPLDRTPIYIELKSNFVYDGEISDGFPNGNGCMRFINAQTMMTTQFDEGDCWSCQGEFSCGIPHGKGEMTDRDGFLMERMFENGLLVEGSWFNMKNDAVFCREGTFYHGVLYGKSCHTRYGSPDWDVDEYWGGFDNDGFYDGKGRLEIQSKPRVGLRAIGNIAFSREVLLNTRMAVIMSANSW